MTQGQSHSTEDKIRGFQSFFSQQLRIFDAINRRYGNQFTYFHFDCHAGCGWNKEVNVIGSPILFSEIANTLNVPFLMCAIEKDESRAAELASRLEDEPNAFVFCGDNRELLGAIPSIISRNGEKPQMAIGSILLDPNNQSTNEIPWDAITKVSKICPRIDIGFNFPVAAMKRIRHLNNGDYVKMEQMPDIVNKKHLLIRQRVGMFIMVVGRNMATGDHKSIGFHKWDSSTGQRLVLYSDLTEEERAAYHTRGQKLLWQDM